MFNVETSILNQVSDVIRSISEDLLVQSNIMENIIQNIEHSWKSDNTYKYIQSNERIKNNIEDISYNLLNLSNNVKTVSGQVCQAENMLENKFNNF